MEPSFSGENFNRPEVAACPDTSQDQRHQSPPHTPSRDGKADESGRRGPLIPHTAQMWLVGCFLACTFVVASTAIQPRSSTAHPSSTGKTAASTITGRTSMVGRSLDASEILTEANNLGRLEGRDLQVVMTASPDGPQYTVVNREGIIVADRLTYESLADQFPETIEMLNSVMPGDSALMDASADFGSAGPGGMLIGAVDVDDHP